LDEQGVKDKDRSLDIGGLNFEFRLILNNVYDDLGIAQIWEFWEKDIDS
jgi:hypothetical protein